MSVYACANCGLPITAPDLRLIAWPTDQDSRAPVVWRGKAALDAGRLVVYPPDLIGVRWIDEQGRWSGQCGPNGDDGPNLVCRSCGEEIGTLYADCWQRLEAHLYPEALVSTDDHGALVVDPRADWLPGIKNWPREEVSPPRGFFRRLVHLGRRGRD